MKAISLFSGIGAFEQAVKNTRLPIEVIAISEIDKKALKTYEILHGIVQNLGDITKIDKLPNAELLIHTSPCQSFSTAGKGLGGVEGSGTKSSLMWETIRLLRGMDTLPKIVIWENVSAVTNKNHINNFNLYLDTMQELGYTNSWKKINAKYYLPQNRDRVFVVSMIGEKFEFPKTRTEVKTNLTDYLEFRDTGDVPSVLVGAKENTKRNIEPFLDEIMKSDKPLYSCSCKSGWGDAKVGIKIAPCFRASKTLTLILDNKLIRDLTAMEKWGLMGFCDDDFHKVKEVVKATTIKKQLGNSIVVPVLEDILKQCCLK